ncbi:nitroreductase family protein [Pseudodesulfovibrio piezophilus]|uniref:Putative NADH dehydrogenase/NAD(P)H nitroreductase n=1 Tax=Pseudodesulfovibrio piezophilus (strain DSM 21447 / JCM 15486 / C1TLV30) TaxID=1322246 RepID=M1WM53_PSEP2|nr:nitroreductase family protein [Pseudodesulfovibrio piezophilus]CCH49005.1 putative NADH dehydrogenase/NAD(P)H nitroreductase [Pseudodesulfovibrio piezophilus C1TLV30]
MTHLDLINSRRSIRKYTEKPIPEEMIHSLLEAAMMAPSAGNAQPWQFVVVTENALLKKASKIHPYVTMAASAQLGILVCGDLSKEKYPGFWVQDCAAAMQNMLLAAHALGLGAVWTGIYPMEDRVATTAKLFNLPESVIPLGFAPLGWPNQHPQSATRYREDRVHYNTY